MTGSVGVLQEVFQAPEASACDREPPVMSLESLCLKPLRLKMSITELYSSS